MDISKKEVKVKEHTRSDGSTVKEHMRRLGFDGTDDNLSWQEAVIGIGIGVLALKGVNGLAVRKMGTSWKDINSSSGFNLLDDLNAPVAKGSNHGWGPVGWGQANDATKWGVFKPESYQHLQGKNYAETLNNIETWFKGKPVEHGFIVDRGGKIKAGFRGDEKMVPMIIPNGRTMFENRRLTYTHNHPGNAPYSGADMLGQAQLKIGRMRAVEPSGEVTQMSFNAGKISRRSLTEVNRGLEEMSEVQTNFLRDIARRKGGDALNRLEKGDPGGILTDISGNDAYRRMVTKTYTDLMDEFPSIFKYEELGRIVKRLHDTPMRAAYAPGMDELHIEGEIAKVDEDARQVFGWASVTEINGQPVVDLQNDVLETIELEKAAYDYVLHSRVGGDMHRRVTKAKDSPKQVGTLIESMVLTNEKIAKMGLPDSTPRGWWIGFQVDKGEVGNEVWKAVKDKKYTGFSIHGLGKRLEKNLSDINKATVDVDTYVRGETTVRAHTRGGKGGSVTFDNDKASKAGIQALIGTGAGALALKYARGGPKTLAIGYGLYALGSLIDAAIKSDEAITHVGKSADTELVEQLVEGLAEVTGKNPADLLEQLGEQLGEETTITPDQLEAFLESQTVSKGVFTRSPAEYQGWLKRISRSAGTTSEEIDDRLKAWLRNTGQANPSDDDIHEFLMNAYGKGHGEQIEKHLIGSHDQKKHDPTKGKGHKRNEHGTDQDRDRISGERRVAAGIGSLLPLAGTPLLASAIRGTKVFGSGPTKGKPIKGESTGGDAISQAASQGNMSEPEVFADMHAWSQEKGMGDSGIGSSETAQYMQDRGFYHGNPRGVNDPDPKEGLYHGNPRGVNDPVDKRQAFLLAKAIQQAHSYDEFFANTTEISKAFADHDEDSAQFFDDFTFVAKHLLGRHEQGDHDPTKKGGKNDHARSDHTGKDRAKSAAKIGATIAGGAGLAALATPGGRAAARMFGQRGAQQARYGSGSPTNLGQGRALPSGPPRARGGVSDFLGGIRGGVLPMNPSQTWAAGQKVAGAPGNAARGVGNAASQAGRSTADFGANVGRGTKAAGQEARRQAHGANRQFNQSFNDFYARHPQGVEATAAGVGAAGATALYGGAIYGADKGLQAINPEYKKVREDDAARIKQQREAKKKRKEAAKLSKREIEMLEKYLGAGTILEQDPS
jgi:hypothetical protein